MSHELKLIFSFDEKFIDEDGNDCSSQYPQYLAENLIQSALLNPEFVSAVYDGDVMIDEDGKVYGFIVDELRTAGWIKDIAGVPYIIRR